MPTESYPKRTEKNVVDSDGTVIFTHGELTGGSLLTKKKAIQHDKPVIHFDMEQVIVGEVADLLRGFIQENGIEILNVAGSRGSKDPEIYGKTFAVIEKIVGASVIFSYLLYLIHPANKYIHIQYWLPSCFTGKRAMNPPIK